MLEDKIEFQFVGIQTMAKNLFALPTSGVVDGFNFDISAGVRVQPAQGLVIMDVEVKIMDSNNAYNYGYFNIWCLFAVANFDKHITLNEKKLYDVPDHLEQTIKPVSISTVRGVIHTNLAGTYLQNAIMPVLYMDNFLKIGEANKGLEKLKEDIKKKKKVN